MQKRHKCIIQFLHMYILYDFRINVIQYFHIIHISFVWWTVHFCVSRFTHMCCDTLVKTRRKMTRKRGNCWIKSLFLFSLHTKCIQNALGFHQKYLHFCSEDEQRSYRFGTTWGWVINDIKTWHSTFQKIRFSRCTFVRYLDAIAQQRTVDSVLTLSNIFCF